MTRLWLANGLPAPNLYPVKGWLKALKRFMLVDGGDEPKREMQNGLRP